MPALSTSWKSKQASSGEALVEALEAFHISGVELEYRITDAMFNGMRNPLKKSGIKIVSIHNFFPAPIHMKGAKPGGDMFPLSHPEKELRRLAVTWTIRSIEHANDLEAQVVVLHGGFVEMATDQNTLVGYFEAGNIDTEEYRSFLAKRQMELARKKKRHIDSLMFSLDRLVREAEKQGVVLTLENRYYDHELPGPEDFGIFFSKFAGAPLGYWHDTGHAHAGEMLGLLQPEELLNRYDDHLIGVHLHDALGLDDHLPPGTGDIDFDLLNGHLKPETLRVLELKPGTPDADVAAGLTFLREKGIVSIDEENGST